MSITVTERTRVTGVNNFGGNPVTLTDSGISVPANSVIIAVVQASDANTNAADCSGPTTTGLTWDVIGKRGPVNNGAGANSSGFVSAWVAVDTAGGTRSVSASVSWADNFTAFRADLKIYIISGANTTAPIGQVFTSGPVQTPAAGAEYTPSLFTASGAGRAFYAITEQNGGSGSDGISTSTDTEDAAYYASQFVGMLAAYKASDHATSASIVGSIDPTAQTYLNLVAFEVLAGSGGGAGAPVFFHNLRQQGIA